MKIAIRQKAAGGAWRCTFRHPVHGGLRAYGLGLDQARADSVCREAVEIFATPALMSDPDSPRLQTFALKAYRMVFEREAPWAERVRADGSLSAWIEDEDAAALAERIAGLLVVRTWRTMGVGTSAAEGDAEIGRLAKVVLSVLSRYESKRQKQLQEKVAGFEAEARAARLRQAEAERALADLQRRLNVGVDVTLAQAFAAWKVEFSQGRAACTVQDGLRSVEMLIQEIGDRRQETGGTATAKLSEVKPAMIDAWLASVKRSPRSKAEEQILAGGGALPGLAAKSKRRMFAGVCGFFAWACARYDLFENPCRKVGKIVGVQKAAGDIRALRRQEEVAALLKSKFKIQNSKLEGPARFELYWRACVGVFVLSGPRYSELVRMKVSDVYFEDMADAATRGSFDGAGGTCAKMRALSPFMAEASGEESLYYRLFCV